MIGIIKTAICINNYYYERKFEKTGGKLLFFKYKKIISKTPYYGPILMELNFIKKIKYSNIKEKLKY